MFSNKEALKMYLWGGGRSPRWPVLEVAHIQMDPTLFWRKIDECGVLRELPLSRDSGKRVGCIRLWRGGCARVLRPRVC